MLVYIIGRNGEYGWIEEDLELTYHGAAATAEAIESCINEIEADAEPREDVVDSLIMQLPEQCAVRETGRETALPRNHDDYEDCMPLYFRREFHQSVRDY